MNKWQKALKIATAKHGNPWANRGGNSPLKYKYYYGKGDPIPYTVAEGIETAEGLVTRYEAMLASGRYSRMSTLFEKEIAYRTEELDFLNELDPTGDCPKFDYDPGIQEYEPKGFYAVYYKALGYDTAAWGW